MDPHGARRLLLTVAVALLVVVAGCSDGGSSSAGDTWNEGDSYTYEINGTNQTLTWTVDSVGGGSLTATVEAGNRSARIRGPAKNPFRNIQDRVQSRFDLITIAPFAGLYQYKQRLVGDRDLTNGSSWTVTPSANPGSGGSENPFGGTGGQFGGSGSTGEVTPPDPSPLSVTVVGTDTVAGVECTVVRATPVDSDEAGARTCVKSDWPFPLSIGSSDGQTSISLTEYQR